MRLEGEGDLPVEGCELFPVYVYAEGGVSMKEVEWYGETTSSADGEDFFAKTPLMWLLRGHARGMGARLCESCFLA